MTTPTPPDGSGGSGSGGDRYSLYAYGERATSAMDRLIPLDPLRRGLLLLVMTALAMFLFFLTRLRRKRKDDPNFRFVTFPGVRPLRFR